MKFFVNNSLCGKIIRPYLELAKFGLEISSSQDTVLKIDMKASFILKDKNILTWVREPNLRLRMDFFCLPYDDSEETRNELSTSTIQTESLINQARNEPNNMVLIHRLAVYCYHKAWESVFKSDYEGMYSLLLTAIPSWAIVVQNKDYMNKWRDSRYATFGKKNIPVMFGEELIQGITQVINDELRTILQDPKIIVFSQARNQTIGEGLNREIYYLKNLELTGGLRDKNGLIINCGPLGIKMLKLQLQIKKKVLNLSHLHPDQQTSYLANVAKNAGPDQKIDYKEVLRLRLGYSEFSEVYYSLKKGDVWQAFNDIIHLVGIESLDQVVELQSPQGSLFYSSDKQGKKLFEQDFWHIVSEILTNALAQELIKDKLNADVIKPILIRIKKYLKNIPSSTEMLSDIEDIFLSRYQTIKSDTRYNVVDKTEQSILLLDMYCLIFYDNEKESRLIKNLSMELRHAGILAANKGNLDQSIKYLHRSLMLDSTDLERLKEVLSIYYAKIRTLNNIMECVSYYKQIFDLFEKASRYHIEEPEFDKMRKELFLKYKVARGAVKNG